MPLLNARPLMSRRCKGFAKWVDILSIQTAKRIMVHQWLEMRRVSSIGMSKVIHGCSMFSYGNKKIEKLI
jgi:hypothetical protein